MSSYKRVRSDSKYEEANVSAFVDSCVDVVSNVSFLSAEEGKALTAPAGRAQTVLILGNEAQLKEYTAASACPYYDAAAAAAAAAAPEARAHVIAASPKLRVLIGKVPSEASRHNCASRPDMISSIIKQAISECPSDDKAAGLDVYYLHKGHEVTAASAIARACNQSFSAKKGLAEQSYLDAGRPVRVVVPSGKPAALSIIAHSVQLCQRLVNAPTNLLDTVTFTEIACRWADKLHKSGVNISTSIIAGEELRERGYGGLYGVGKAAEYPPHLVTLSYKPQEGISPKDKIAFVGKGIVYDTGGLSIKPGAGMCTMKHDMGGAAAVFCGLLALAQLGAPVEASSTLCIADNAVGPRSQRPDDIIRMKSGMTVEINNTDAEGRIVLSDGVAHACKELGYTPNIIVDMATLTGVQMIATGMLHASIYTNSDAAEARFFKAGLACGDMCYPVLYCPELHTPEYPSKVADFRNSLVGRTPNASVSTAGRFVEMNLTKDYKGEWVHVDLAGPATRDEATGFGVTLIAQLYAAEQL